VAAVIHRIRAGEDVEAVVGLIKDGDLLLQSQLHPQTQFQYKFPFKSAMPISLGGTDIPYLSSILYHETMGSSTTMTTTTSTVDDYRHAYNIPFHAAGLVEPRLDSIKASRWTAVTTSDALVRRLLEIYFLQEFTFTTFFHKDYFLDDMVAGRERFCSSLLVNAVLACAWVSRMLLYSLLAA
jgi:hypothetical protein